MLLSYSNYIFFHVSKIIMTAKISFTILASVNHMKVLGETKHQNCITKVDIFYHGQVTVPAKQKQQSYSQSIDSLNPSTDESICTVHPNIVLWR